MQQQFPVHTDFWFTGYDARVAGRDDLESNYPWHYWRESYSERMRKVLQNPAEVPNPARFNLMSDVDRASTIINIQPLPKDPLVYTWEANENREQWFRERGLSDSQQSMQYLLWEPAEERQAEQEYRDRLEEAARGVG